MERFSFFKPFVLPEECKEVNDLPSMVEECYNPSIADIVNNPNCLLRPSPCMYDNGDDVVEVDSYWDNDIQNVFGNEDAYANAPQAQAEREQAKRGTKQAREHPAENGEPIGEAGGGSEEVRSTSSEEEDVN